MFSLKNERLEVSIAEPNKECVTCRFDRAGFITGVRLDGKYEFLAQEDMLDGSPSSGGMGLCCEYRFDPMSAGVKVGEKFPKFGVGNLTKTEEGEYFFMNTYPCEDYEVTVREEDNCLIFNTVSREINGYAVEQEKIVSIAGNTLTISTILKNVGSKRIDVDEYCHNFMTLNKKKVNSDYCLEISCVELPKGDIKTNEKATYFHSDGKYLTKSEESMVFALYAFDKSQMKKADKYGWTLVDKTNGLCVSEEDDFAADGVTVWSVGDAISPEMFYANVLMPGECCKWSRTYTFDKK